MDKHIKKPKLRELAEWIIALLIAAVVFLILRQFFSVLPGRIGVSGR